MTTEQRGQSDNTPAGERVGHYEPTRHIDVGSVD
ncbi:hypothetical protein MELE44368_14305 [Mycolicibacterium elephantis DSM 44368]|uniref:Uncharacterized protein n=1 Tax=Mycolicibacterium elephantis DSM 44368 TaxID=1335622 RepID=A0A439DX01_9MYCO|nr:hypothetical protein MELE44368_14305 [Mycolicibacterium elephantis DSM 44368]